jgi:hypothetical protein
LVTLKDEERLGRPLFADLAEKQQARARLSHTALRNILFYAGRERANAGKAGLAAANLGPAKRDLLWQLVETYTVVHLSQPLASARKGRIISGDGDAVHLARYEPNAAETGFSYRVIGDYFFIEMGSVDLAAQHYDLASVLGQSAP